MASDDDHLKRILAVLARKRPPDGLLRATFERWQRRRRRGWALGTFGLAAALLVGLKLLGGAGSEPPVYLELDLVDVQSLDVALPDELGVALGHGAEELDTP